MSEREVALDLPDWIDDHFTDEEHLGEVLDTAIVMARSGHDEDDFLEVVESDASPEALAAIYRVAVAERAAYLADRRAKGIQSNIEDAFDELNERGVLARANFACCGTCASAEILEEFDDSRPWQGYVYFHMQDSENIPEAGNTYLGYGWYVPSRYPTEESWMALSPEERERIYEAEGEKVINEIVRPTLDNYGMTVEWDGDWNRRILVDGIVDYEHDASAL